jgi:hypothetical protein
MNQERRDEARALLQALLNLEWPTRIGGLLQPFAQSVRAALRQRAEALLAALGMPVRRVQHTGDLAAAVAAALQALGEVAPASDLVTVEVPPVPDGLRVLGERRFIGLVRACKRLHAATGVQCLLHGSLATDDWTGYRDVDLLLLLPRTTVTSAGELEVLRRECVPLLRAMLQIDPLQHHGVFALPMQELGGWPEHFLPVAALQRALHLSGGGLRLQLCPRLDRKAALAELAWAVQRLHSQELPRDAYGWKAYASVVMLLPALYLAATGRPSWKGDSFALVEAEVPPALWEVQRWAAHLRQHWRLRDGGVLRACSRLLANPRAGALLARRFAAMPRELTPPHPERILRAAYELAAYLHKTTAAPAELVTP